MELSNLNIGPAPLWVLKELERAVKAVGLVSVKNAARVLRVQASLLSEAQKKQIKLAIDQILQQFSLSKTWSETTDLKRRVVVLRQQLNLSELARRDGWRLKQLTSDQVDLLKTVYEKRNSGL